MQLTDTEEVFTLFMSSMTFHADWMTEYAPVYIGQQAEAGGYKTANASGDGIHAVNQTMRGRPRIISINTLQHVHELQNGGFRSDFCKGMCVWANGNVASSVYTNTTMPTEKGDELYIPLTPYFPLESSVTVQNADSVTWESVIPDMVAHQAWVNTLVEVCAIPMSYIRRVFLAQTKSTGQVRLVFPVLSKSLVKSPRILCVLLLYLKKLLDQGIQTYAIYF